MARITLDGLRHTYSEPGETAAAYALKGLDLAFEDGGAYALLGPSGCGKSTLLNIISGLLTPSEGRVLFDEQDVTRATTSDRNIAQVFQFPVVYDTMSVRQNIAFPLKNRGVRGPELDARVKAILELIGLEHVADRRARGLSADQKQKVSLGRGLVRSDVNAILFDEPLTVIDPHLKWRLRTQLKSLHRETARTMIYVTHDQTEALTFADQVVVMFDGEVVQVGAPQDLFERPEHTFVGHFIGSPGMNLLPAQISADRARVGSVEVQLPGRATPQPQQKTELGVRPEHVKLGTSGYDARLERVDDVGRYRIAVLGFGGETLKALVPEGVEIPAAPKVSFEPNGLHLFADSRRMQWEGRA